MPAPYDRNRAEERDRAGRSKKMAGWALGLSFVWCLHPFTLLASAGLAIAALARSGGGPSPRDHGRGLAVAALVIDLLWVVLVVVLLVTGGFRALLADADRDDDGRVTEPTDIPVLNLDLGDCANDPQLAELEGDDAVETFELEVVPCTHPHDFEVFHRFEPPDGDYPGEDALFRTADDVCWREVRGFVGGTKGVRALGVSYYVPKATGWRLFDDREILCVIGRPGKKTVGSLEGFGRR